MARVIAVSLAVTILGTPLAQSQTDVASKIRTEGVEHSQVQRVFDILGIDDLFRYDRRSYDAEPIS